MNATSPNWIRRDFSGADLGDVRRTRRLVTMLGCIEAARGRTVADTFACAPERQAAYDFLEHETVSAADLDRAASAASARHARFLPEVLVVVDGTSLSLVDKKRRKDLGSIGAKTMGVRGLKYMTTLLVAPTGAPIGIGPLTWWRRDHQLVDRRRYRPAGERESKYWHDAIDAAAASMASYAPGTKCHFVCDREADASRLLKDLVNSEHEFTIRGNQRRNVEVDGRRVSLLKHVRRAAPVLKVLVDVPGSSRQRARRAVLEVRRARVDVMARDKFTGSSSRVPLSVVWAKEIGTVPKGSARLDWVLYTSKPVQTAAQAKSVITTYTRRWRIEDFHRTWKRGSCHVERNQLRSASAVVKWATLTAVVAARTERLKHLARNTPDEPATIEFTHAQLEALRIMKEEQKKRTETLGPGVPSIAVATRWVADIGGYVGARSSGPPGATVIGRGLERLEIATAAIAAYKADRRKKRSMASPSVAVRRGKINRGEMRSPGSRWHLSLGVRR